MVGKGDLDESEVEKPEKTMSGIIHLAPLVCMVWLQFKQPFR